MINNDQNTLLLCCCEDVKSHSSGGDAVPLRGNVSKNQTFAAMLEK